MLMEEGKFLTKYVSQIEADPVGDYAKCRKVRRQWRGETSLQVLSDLGLSDVSVDDCSAVRHICETVSRRAAFMAAASLTHHTPQRLAIRGDHPIGHDRDLFRCYVHLPTTRRDCPSEEDGLP